MGVPALWPRLPFRIGLAGIMVHLHNFFSIDITTILSSLLTFHYQPKKQVYHFNVFSIMFGFGASSFSAKDIPDLSGKVILVTGGTRVLSLVQLPIHYPSIF